MATYYENYLTVAMMAVLGMLLFGGMIGLARLVAPRRLFKEKLETYECGVDPIDDGWSQTQVRYYIFALLFVIFDVEAAFIFPWATIMGSVANAGAVLVEMFVFIAILVVALVYAIRKGVLRWM